MAQRISCPLFIIAGPRDRLFGHQDAQRLVAEAAGPAQLWLIDGGNHGVANLARRHASQCADWMADRPGEVG